MKRKKKRDGEKDRQANIQEGLAGGQEVGDAEGKAKGRAVRQTEGTGSLPASTCRHYSMSVCSWPRKQACLRKVNHTVKDNVKEQALLQLLQSDLRERARDI